MASENRQKTRREFLKKGMVGAAGISILPTFLRTEGQARERANNINPNIVCRTLGRTGLRVPIVSVGCGAISDPVLINAALDKGLKFFDTAPGYGGGRNENILGEVFKGKPRDAFIVASKIDPPEDSLTGLVSQDLDLKSMKSYFSNALNASLERMQLDHLDILFMYDVINPRVISHKILKEALLQIKQSGKTRFLGVSTHQNEPDVILAAAEEKIYDVILTAYNFRQPHKEEVSEAVAAAAKSGLGVVAMKTMAGVFWDKERMKPINTKAALKWVLQNENVHTAVPGIKTFEELEQDLAILSDPKLTFEEKADLKLDERETISGLYCAQCGLCRTQCRFGLDIPTVMRSFMYAYGYQEPVLAKTTLRAVPMESIECRKCDPCSVRCTMGFNVSEKMADIIRILNVPDAFLG